MAIHKVEQAFAELKNANVIGYFERKNISGPRRKLLDVIFTLLPSGNFIRDTRASSKRLNLAVQNGTPPLVGLGGHLSNANDRSTPLR
jgi:hypothetical protein